MPERVASIAVKLAFLAPAVLVEAPSRYYAGFVFLQRDRSQDLIRWH
jgi:hypothetical protein